MTRNDVAREILKLIQKILRVYLLIHKLVLPAMRGHNVVYRSKMITISIQVFSVQEYEPDCMCPKQAIVGGRFPIKLAV